MLSMVKEALYLEKEMQAKHGITCTANIAGYTDFVFLNRFGYCHNNGTINKMLVRVIRDYNEEQMDLLDEGVISDEEMVLLPRFSCHSLRHTFATRMVEMGVNVKVVQEALGHADVATTLNIYAKATDELKKKEFSILDSKLDFANVKT